MKRMKVTLIFTALLALLLAVPITAQNTLNYMAQGGGAWYIGGTQNILTGGTLTADSGSILNVAGTFKIGGVTVSTTAAQLNFVYNVTAGTIAASKAVVVDANKDASTFRNLTATNYDAGSSGVAGSLDIFPTTAARGKLAITAAESAGDTTTTIVNASQASGRTLTIPDGGSATANFVLSEGAATINGAKTFSAAMGSVLKNSADLGTGAVAGNSTAVEYGDGVVHKTVLTITLTGAADIDLADDAHGTGKNVYNFPEGRIKIIGVGANLVAITNNVYNATPNDLWQFGIGSVMADDAATLAATEVDFIADTTLDTASSTVLTHDVHAVNVVDFSLDGTTVPAAVYINAAIAAASQTAPTTHDVQGTLTITWVNLGDY